MTDDGQLQFERAEFNNATEKAACSMCTQPLFRSYYQINGLSVCVTCCGRVRMAQTGGSAIKRGTMAFVAGLAAAAFGSALYYGVLALTGYEVGLISIVVGFAVGKAVSWGSDARGGWPYQTMAVVLTYLAIVSAYVPMIVSEIRKADQVAELEVTDPALEPAAAAIPVTAGEPAADANPSAAAEPLPPIEEAPITAGGAVFAILLLFALMCAAPFLAGFSNIIGLLIIGFGVYQAWKMNVRQEAVITGPHALARPAAPAPAPAAAAAVAS